MEFHFAVAGAVTDSPCIVTVVPPAGAAAGSVTDNVTSVVPELPSVTFAGDTVIVITELADSPESKKDCGPGPFAFTARILMYVSFVNDADNNVASVDDASVPGKSFQSVERVAEPQVGPVAY